MGFSSAFGMQAGGAAMSAVGSYYGAKSQASSLAFQSNMDGINAQISDTNSRIAELGAQSALYQGNAQVAARTLQAGQVVGAQRASMAANGVDLGQGNAAEVQASTNLLKDIDVNTITANAVRSAWGYRTQAMNAQIQGSNQRIDGMMKSSTASSINPWLSGGTSLLGSATSLSSSWYKNSLLTKGGGW